MGCVCAKPNSSENMEIVTASQKGPSEESQNQGDFEKVQASKTGAFENSNVNNSNVEDSKVVKKKKKGTKKKEGKNKS